MGELTFEDAYSLVPNSTERVVVLGPASTMVNVDALPTDSSWSSANYDLTEINEFLDNLTDTFTTKAYDITYSNYVELVVEDEMGYFNPSFLGTKYNKSTKSVAADFATTYVASRYPKGIDGVIANATMWGDNEHYSINDAIDALRQQLKILDADDTAGFVGVKKLFGGYKVTNVIPTIGTADIDDSYNANYTYSNGGTNIAINGSNATSKYNLSSVLDALAQLAYIDSVIGKEVEADYTSGKESNRAIYVNVADATAAAHSYIYLLHNKNYRALGADKEGVFTFNDRMGNRLYYQDKIFAGVEWLALVVIGTKGLIFVVNRHGETETSKVAWMVNEGNFITDKQAAVCVSNGLIHTIDVVVNDETFEATCAIKSMSIRKTKKTVNRYVPVLFLDTLKVSTIE
jgi:hypothetical protein